MGVLCSGHSRSVLEAMWVGLLAFQGRYRWKYRHALVFLAAFRISVVRACHAGRCLWEDWEPSWGKLRCSSQLLVLDSCAL